MKILIVGFGSIARRHIQNLKFIDHSIRIAVLRQHSKSADLGEFVEHVEMVFYRFDDALSWCPDVAILTNPASMHIDVAKLLATRGIHMLIEKPISNSLKNVREFLEECKSRSIVVMVGYNLRFHKSLQLVKKMLEEGAVGRIMTVRVEVGQYLPDWRKSVDYRETVTAQESLGGGVVLELSHELDYVQWLIGDVHEVVADIRRSSNLDIDVEDTAEMILRFKNCIVGSIHLDMTQRSPVRTCCVVGTDGTLFWNGIDGCVKLYTAQEGKWKDCFPVGSIDRNEMYVDELKHFFDCVEKRCEPSVSGWNALRVLEMALAAKRSSESGRFEVI